jgi:hypothetical protein
MYFNRTLIDVFEILNHSGAKMGLYRIGNHEVYASFLTTGFF